MKDGNYEVRAEIPGVDPGKDVDITVRDGVLTIKAERTEKKESNGRSEFSYGSFIRSVTLPAGADEDAIKASYDNGILTVQCPYKAVEAAEKHVSVSPGTDPIGGPGVPGYSGTHHPPTGDRSGT